jgi:hypothetical protein
MLVSIWSKFMELESEYSAVTIATGWTSGILFPAGVRHFCLLHSVQSGYGAHPASYPMGIGDSFHGK